MAAPAERELLPDLVCYNTLAVRCAGCGKIGGITTGGYRCWWERPPLVEAVVCGDCYTPEILKRVYSERIGPPAERGSSDGGMG